MSIPQLLSSFHFNEWNILWENQTSLSQVLQAAQKTAPNPRSTVKDVAHFLPAIKPSCGCER